MENTHTVLVVTSENIANYRIVKTFGEVFGQTTRSRNIFSNIGQQLKSIVGGEIRGYTQLQDDARFEALARMQAQAAELGANAVIMFRFDTSSSQIGDSVAAYGTAVRIEPIN